MDFESIDAKTQHPKQTEVDDQAAGVLPLRLALLPPELADLADVVKAWPTLPADVRKMIVGVVQLTPRTVSR